MRVTTSSSQRLRAALLAVMLFFASTLFAGSVSADVLVPGYDIGAPGGSGGVAAVEAETAYGPMSPL